MVAIEMAEAEMTGKPFRNFWVVGRLGQNVIPNGIIDSA